LLATDKRRPAAVWIILAFYTMGTALSIFVYWGGLSLVLGEVSFHESSFFDRILGFLLGLTNLWGAVALFQLRRHALYVFIGALVIRSVSLLWHQPGSALLNQTGLRVLAGSLALPLAVTAYTWRQKRNGILS